MDVQPTHIRVDVVSWERLAIRDENTGASRVGASRVVLSVVNGRGGSCRRDGCGRKFPRAAMWVVKAPAVGTAWGTTEPAVFTDRVIPLRVLL